MLAKYYLRVMRSVGGEITEFLYWLRLIELLLFYVMMRKNERPERGPRRSRDEEN